MPDPIWCEIREHYCTCERRCTDAASDLSFRISHEDVEDDGEDDDDSYYCNCGAVHSGIEDGGRCEACGKVV